MAGKTTHTINVQLTSKNILSLDELELYELCHLAGINMEPSTFKIILDLLKMNVSPQAVLQMLKTMCAGRKKQPAGSNEQLGHYLESNMPPLREKPAKSRNFLGTSGVTSRK